MMTDVKKRIGIIILIILLLGISTFTAYKITHKEEKHEKKPIVINDKDFNSKFIKTVHSYQDSNYLISPYSVEIALNMLREGSNGETLEEINSFLPEREIPNISIKNKIGIANAAFIREQYNDYIEKPFIEVLKNNYQAEVLVDSYTTPDKINNWVDQHTNHMIKKILEEMNEEFVMGLANALAIDVEWNNPFDCGETTEESFTNQKNEKKKVEMMHKTYSYDVEYFETENAKGVILPYKTYNKEGKEENEGRTLEFVGILPKSDMDTYMNQFSQEELENINQERKELDNKELELSLPRFRYDFDLDNFMQVLEDMGMKKAFNPEEADLSKIIKKENLSKIAAQNIYVSKAIHKTAIDLNEKGTKAAAVTYFGIEKYNAMIEEKEKIKMNFNKTFAYMIQDKETKEILFFGVVDKPNQWKGTTCSD